MTAINRRNLVVGGIAVGAVLALGLSLQREEGKFTTVSVEGLKTWYFDTDCPYHVCFTHEFAKDLHKLGIDAEDVARRGLALNGNGMVFYRTDFGTVIFRFAVPTDNSSNRINVGVQFKGLVA